MASLSRWRHECGRETNIEGKREAAEEGARVPESAGKPREGEGKEVMIDLPSYFLGVAVGSAGWTIVRELWRYCRR
ncbi:hypothetical protein ECB98_15150 [Brucellaceae bacterium VT-16-1752]|nr:hypothetical protein ECB98_15150 [Brucellaceae bacterium VT-16-1752]